MQIARTLKTHVEGAIEEYATMKQEISALQVGYNLTQLARCQELCSVHVHNLEAFHCRKRPRNYYFAAGIEREAGGSY